MTDPAPPKESDAPLFSRYSEPTQKTKRNLLLVSALGMAYQVNMWFPAHDLSVIESDSSISFQFIHHVNPALIPWGFAVVILYLWISFYLQANEESAGLSLEIAKALTGRIVENRLTSEVALNIVSGKLGPNKIYHSKKNEFKNNIQQANVELAESNLQYNKEPEFWNEHGHNPNVFEKQKSQLEKEFCIGNTRERFLDYYFPLIVGILSIVLQIIGEIFFLIHSIRSF